MSTNESTNNEQVMTASERDFYKEGHILARLIEDDAAPGSLKDEAVERIAMETLDIVRRINFADPYVVEHLYPLVKELERRGKVYGKDGSLPKLFDRSLVDK